MLRKIRMLRAYSVFEKPVYGTLAAEDDAMIIKSLDDSIPSSPRVRFSAKTLENKSPSPRMLKLPEAIASEIGSMTRDNSPQELRQRASVLYKSLSRGESHRPSFTSLEADAHIQATTLQNYASIYQVLKETASRIPEWKPKRVLDIGFGPATGIMAVNEVFGSIERKVAVVFGHYRMRRRAQQLLRIQEAGQDSETIFKHHVPAITATTTYDLIIATHQLFQSGPNNNDIIDSHAKRLVNLLSPGGVLVFIERGDAYGFEAVARARQVIIRPEDVEDITTSTVPHRDFTTQQQVDLKIIAPCSHHGQCPLQLGLDQRLLMKNPGSESWCRFSQNVQRPKFALEFKKGKYLAQQWDEEAETEYGQGKGGKSLAGKGRPNGHGHEVANHSYLVVQRSSGEKSPHEPEKFPRVLRNPLKRRGHVTMEVCAPTGQIEHWTVSKSQGKIPYHDVRKASQGDLWPLGAKSVQVRGGLSASAREEATELANTTKHTDSVETAAPDYWQTAEDPNPLDLLSSGIPEHDPESISPNSNRSAKLDRKERQKRYREWAE